MEIHSFHADLCSCIICTACGTWY